MPTSERYRVVVALAVLHLAALATFRVAEDVLAERNRARLVEVVGPEAAPLFHAYPGSTVTNTVVHVLSLPLLFFAGGPWFSEEPNAAVFQTLVCLLNSLLWGYATAGIYSRLGRRSKAVEPTAAGRPRGPA